MMPIRNIKLDNRTPPTITEVRLPHLSARIAAGIEMMTMRIPESPEARKPAVFSGRPACAKRVGA